jgi:cytochrome c biogenesis protein
MEKIFKTKFLKKLANLQFAIILLFTIGLIIALGTIIEQDQDLNFYKDNYSEIKPMFGFLTWKIILFFNLDRIYTSWWFIMMLFLFGSSLLACTFTTQLPSLKTFKIWKFNSQLSDYSNLGVSENLNSGGFNTVAYNCNVNRYHFFQQNKKGYAYSGLLGRIGPIVVHASIILLLVGSTFGSFGGYIAQELIPRGEIFHVQNLTKFGDFSYVPQNISCRINNFWITYTKELKTDQFYSDLSILDKEGKELKRKIIFVNEPLIFNDLVLYQTDWDIIGLKLSINKDKIFQIPLKRITKAGNRFWFGSLKFDAETLTIVVNDLKGKIYFYNTNGVLVKEVFVGDSINLNNGIDVQVIDFLTSTGVQIKSDPGISTVYLSFLLLMVSIYVSFLTYSQIWLIETKKNIVVGGNSNRAVLFFQEQFRQIVRRSTRI